MDNFKVVYKILSALEKTMNYPELEDSSWKEGDEE